MAKTSSFLSMEDEKGIANMIVVPDLYERERLVVTRSKHLLVEGKLQNQGGVVNAKAFRIVPLLIVRWVCVRLISLARDASFERVSEPYPVQLTLLNAIGILQVIFLST